MLVRIHFKYKGSLHKKYSTGTVDAEIEGSQYHNHTQEESMLSEADDILECMVTRGLLDCECDYGVDTFAVIKVETEFDGEANFII